MAYGFTIGDRLIDDGGDIHPLRGIGYARHGEYTIVGASTAGALHLAHDLPRDDAFLVRASGDWLAVGVSDGVGSRSLSRYGATFTAASLARHLLQQLTAPLRGELRGGTAQLAENRDAAVPRDADDFSFQIGGADSSAADNNDARPRVALSEIASIGWFESPNQSSAAEDGADKLMADGVAATPPDGESSKDDAAAIRDLEDAPLKGDSLMSRIISFGRPHGAVTNIEVSPALDHRSPDQGLPVERDLTLLMHTAFERTFEGLKQHADELGVSLADISCTAVALLLNVADGRWVTAQVGDGAIFGLRASGDAEELGPDEESEDTQQTYTITHDDWHKHFSCRAGDASDSDPAIAFFVMTDGVANDVIYSPKPQAIPTWTRGVERNVRAAPTAARAAAGMLQWLATYKAPASFDDRTLVVVTRSEEH